MVLSSLLSDVTSVGYAVNFMYHNTTSDTIRKHNPLQIEEYSPCNEPLTEKIKHLKVSYYLRDSITD